MSVYIEGKDGPWEVVIGLEVHAQVKSRAKLFSKSSTVFGSDPNTQVSFLDAGLPGTLPVLNHFCVEQAIKTGLGINAEINEISIFDRKNYFYPDLPLGYQITQFYYPIVEHGYVDIDMEDDEAKRIRVNRIHLETDAGKSIHDMHPQRTFIDLNRAGIALMEIVSEPDMHSSKEAMAYFKKLRTILRYLDTCDGNMEQGSMRADANVSIHRPGTPLGLRSEVKNLNSIRFLGQAIDYEINRQIDVLESGGTLIQETRLFNTQTGKTKSMRTKEDAQEYRYFPDPDLKPLVISREHIESVRKTMPELPDEKREKLIEKYGLSHYDASVLVAEKETVKYFERVLVSKELPKEGPKMVANWLLGEVFAKLKDSDSSIAKISLDPAYLAKLVSLILDNTISGKIAKDVFAKMWDENKDPAKLVKELGLEQITNIAELEKLVTEVILNNPKQVEAYKNGKDQLFGFFVGQVMKSTQGKANPKIVNDLLKKKL